MLVHSMNTWVLENNQAFLWQKDDARQRRQRNLPRNLPNISRNVLGRDQRTEADHQGSVQILILSGFNRAV